MVTYFVFKITDFRIDIFKLNTTEAIKQTILNKCKKGLISFFYQEKLEIRKKTVHGSDKCF